MDDFRIELFTAREKRAAALVMLAVGVVAVAALSYLRPAPPAAARVAAAAPTPLPPAILSLAPESASSVYAVVGQNGFAVSDDPTRRVVRSTDGGRSWRTLALPRDAGRPFSVSAVPGGDVVVTTTDTAPAQGFRLVAAWRSSDHGAHWTRLAAPGGRSVPRMVDHLHGYSVNGSAAGYSVEATADGGRTWTAVIDLPPGTTELAGVAIPATRTVLFTATGPTTFWLVVSERSTAGLVLPGARPLLFASDDAGRRWRPVPLEVPAPPDGAGWMPAPPEIGADGRGLLLLRALRPGSSPNAGLVTTAAVVTTADGGATWSPARASAHLTIQLGPGDGWWAAEGASLFFSADEGATWRDIAVGIPRTDQLGPLLFVDARTIWSFAPSTPDALRSTDGGRTWKEVLGPAR